jgi:uncharacterized membrane protein YfcA
MAGIRPDLLLFMFASGLVISCVATFLGVGGGIMMVPLLIFLFPELGVSPACAVHLAIGTSLLVIFIRSIPAAISYRNRDLIVSRAVIPLALTSIIGTFLGSNLAAHLPGDTLRKVFAFIMFAAALRMAFSRPIRTGESEPKMTWWMLLFVGSTAGFFSSLLGIPTKKLAGTSTAIMIFTSLAGMLQYVYFGYGSAELPACAVGYVHWAAAVPLAAGGMLSAPLGAYLNHRLNVTVFKQAFAVVLVIVAVRMLLF